MKINFKTKNLEATPSIHIYVEEKLGPLQKFLRQFESQGVDELTILISRTTAHHHKGEVFEAKTILRLPGRRLYAEARGENIRAAIDAVKDKLHLEIEKYKTKYLGTRKRP